MSARLDFDLVVIGAGWHGIVAAKIYQEVNPGSKITVLDADSSVGGVWSEERLYPGLKSNNLLGTYEYSDFPMDSATYGVQAGEHIPGAVLHRYLTDYAKKFNVYENIKFKMRVQSAERQDGGGWLLMVLKDGKESQIYAKKLIVATGMTSEPFLPKFSGGETFGVPLFHIKQFNENAHILETAKTVTVFGGTKSAWDAVYACAMKGIKVDWVIRESGHGPVWMAPPYVTPLKRWLEKLVHTRFLTWFSPCIWGNFDGYPCIRSFFHGTSVGRFIVDTFWKILAGDVISLNNYDGHPETAKLKPWTNPFFIGSGLSILNYDTDFFELVRNGSVRVHIADVVGLEPKTMILPKGEQIKTDALIYATGWRHTPPIKFLPANIDLGLPHASCASDPVGSFEKADAEILSRYPRLKNQPERRPNFKPLSESQGISDPEHNAETDFQPFSLYRFMVPPSTISARDIAFAGATMTISTALMAQAQALWITAYLSNYLEVPEDVAYETILYSRFGKWRYPEGYKVCPDFVFDAVPYIDMLLTDLGIENHRKESAVKEIFEAYGPEDYKGLVGEWMGKLKKD